MLPASAGHPLSIQNLLTRNRGPLLSVNQVKGLNVQQVDELLPNRDLALAIKADLPVMSSADEQPAILERTILERVTRRPPFSFLRSARAIGEILALTIMLETSDIGRLCRVGNFASYGRWVIPHIPLAWGVIGWVAHAARHNEVGPEREPADL